MFIETKTEKSLRMMGNQFRKGKVPWNKGKRGVQLVSEETKEKLRKVRMGNQNSRKPRSQEIKDKIKGYVLRGKDHPNWRGGVARNRRSGLKYREWRESVFQRDDWTCQTCGCRGVYLESHHIKSWAEYPELRYLLNNGVTLCRDCHKLTDNYKGKCTVKPNAFHRNNGNKKD